MINECIFCKIVREEIPCYKIAESNNFLAFLDIAPINQGHTLIIPKEHYKDLEELPEELAQEQLSFTQEVMQLVKKTVGCEGINVGSNNGSAAGQAVFHQHTHIIPRFGDDGLSSWPNKDVSKEELVALHKEFLEKKE